MQKKISLSEKSLVLSVFAVIFSCIIFYFEKTSYIQKTKVDSILVESLIDVNEDKYYGTFIYEDKEYIKEIEKEIFVYFHYNGQKPLNSYIFLSDFETKKSKNLAYVLSEKFIYASSGLVVFSLIMLLLLKSRKNY